MSVSLISVVICTYNRADLLADVLQTVCEQTLDESYYEIIVVDNNSSDNTRAVAEEFSRRYANLHYCLETRIGLSHARNRGWREAQGGYVAYVDDDCKAPEQWLAVARDVIDRLSPAVFGGPAYAFYNSSKPRWYKDSYATHEPFKQAQILSGRECINIYGMNMVFRTSLLKAIGGFKDGLGMSGINIGYGEEIDLHLNIRSKMPDQVFYYDPNFYVYHLVQGERMTLRWLVCSQFAMGRALYKLFKHNDSQIIKRRQLVQRFVRVTGALAGDLVRGVFSRDRARYPYVQNYLHENTSQNVREMGSLYEQYRQIIQQAQSSIEDGN
jgi:glycosyltransferase involved in cell wall biosynthesis